MGKTVTIRLNDEESKFFEEGAALYKGSLSSIIKRLAIEKLEDEYDLAIAADYEKRKKNGKLVLHPIEELFDELGIDYNDLQD